MRCCLLGLKSDIVGGLCVVMLMSVDVVEDVVEGNGGDRG